MRKENKHEYCFILGISPRSGTNFFFKLLAMHEDCYGEGPVWEDFFVECSYILKKFCNKVNTKWNPSWNVGTSIGGEKALLASLGEGLALYLDRQIKINGNQEVKYLLSKTPSVKNLHNFFELFPNSKLIIIIRDGRSVVQSGEKTFNWGFELACKNWNKAAEQVLSFKENNSNKNNFFIIKYEDLYLNMEDELKNVFDFLKLDPSVYDFEKAKDLGFIGSSEVKKSKTEKMHWKEVNKSEISNPLTRFSVWSDKKHDRYNWLAGKSHSKLGYEEKFLTKSSISIIYNYFLDFTLYLRAFPRLCAMILKLRNRSLTND